MWTLAVCIILCFCGGIIYVVYHLAMNEGKNDFIDLSSREKVDLEIPYTFLIGITKSPVKSENDYGITCDGIYEIDFADMSRAKLFYANQKYTYFKRPYIKNGELYCTAVDKSTAKNTRSMGGHRNVILKIKNGEAKEVVSTHRPIADYYVKDDHTIIYSYSDDASPHYELEKNIEICDQNTGKTEKIFNYHIQRPRREFLITLNPLTLIVDNYDAQIIQVNEQGEQKVLIDDGRVPSWYEEGKSILYQ